MSDTSSSLNSSSDDDSSDSGLNDYSLKPYDFEPIRSNSDSDETLSVSSLKKNGRKFTSWKYQLVSMRKMYQDGNVR